MGSYNRSRIDYFLRIIGIGLFLGLIITVSVHFILFPNEVIKTELAYISKKTIEFTTDYYQIFVFVYVCFIGAIIFLENQNSNSTLNWLFILILFPIVGIIAYWILGPDLRYHSRRKRLKLPKQQKIQHQKHTESANPFINKTAALIYSSSLEELHTNCSVKILLDGEQTYSAMLEKIRMAKKSVFFQSFIIANDEIGETFKKELAQKAREGLSVCLLYDAVGSWKLSRSSLAELKKAGVYVYSFLPTSLPMLRGANYRNHRKTLIIDNTWGFMGGVNIREYYLKNTNGQLPWRDTHCMLQGPVIKSLLQTLLHDLEICGASETLIQYIKQDIKTQHTAQGSTTLQIATSGPDSDWDTIKKAYLSLFTTAKKNLWITTPYLIPGSGLQDALCVAALSGVDVRILIPGEPDHPMVFWASLHSCEELLRAGVRIYQYKPDRFIHAKTTVCDSAVFSVGTANIDTRSFSINFESQAFIYDAELAKEGEKIFLKDISTAKELVFEQWIKRPLSQKIRENIGKLITPMA
ncbi:cardiolipin synthase [Desulfovibrio litoralis]|uniref:Cardiolipin synthase n=1 Tax=Desulfovibrio litoralis DSM 11393 TaxID=1121455 RepID=A0A1M7RZ06_9BACT|nr:cardiolipin synthase [Desulfovibrio litoralis]SHN51421.1 cardiolipin synthetase 2 [Desulfovibrio litoralis DSM 11393]